VDDLRVGRIARALRHRLGLTQAEVGRRWGRSQDRVSWIERGRLDAVPLGRLRKLFAVFDAEVVVYIRWRGGDVDRLLDRGHAALAERFLQELQGLGWTASPEVSYSDFGERGSIDLLGWHGPTRSLLVVEIKTELTSIEETIRRHDGKARLAIKVARDRLDWRATSVARLLVLPDERTPRRHVERHEGLFRQAYPLRGRAMRGWLASPGGEPLAGPSSMSGGTRPLSGLLFVSSNGGTRPGQRISSVRRVRNSAPPHRAGRSTA